MAKIRGNYKEKYFSPSAFSSISEFEDRNWWFRSRRKLIIWAIERHCNQVFRFLEVGCGTGFVLEAVKMRFKSSVLYGSEYHEEGLTYARQRVPSANFQQLDATTMCQVENFDVIGAFDVLEHIAEDEEVIENLARATTVGGILIITVPQHPWLWSAVDEYACHVRRYSRSDIVLKLQNAGLKIEYVSSFVTFLLPFMWISRFKKRNRQVDPADELDIPRWLNFALSSIMVLERFLLRLGFKFRAGGSLLLVGRKLTPTTMPRNLVGNDVDQ